MYDRSTSLPSCHTGRLDRFFASKILLEWTGSLLVGLTLSDGEELKTSALISSPYVCTYLQPKLFSYSYSFKKYQVNTIYIYSMPDWYFGIKGTSTQDWDRVHPPPLFIAFLIIVCV